MCAGGDGFQKDDGRKKRRVLKLRSMEDRVERDKKKRRKLKAEPVSPESISVYYSVCQAGGAGCISWEEYSPLHFQGGPACDEALGYLYGDGKVWKV